MTELRIGCSGWVYREWRDAVYGGTPPSRWFDLYARCFDTVEINATFYRLPTVATVERWAEQAPPHFRYSPKLGQFCSHRKKLDDHEQWLGNHLDRVRRLGPHLGPNLVQLPPRWRRDIGRLDSFLSAAPTDIAWAVEVRDRSWLHDDLFACLARHGAALCIHDLLDDHPWVLTTDWTYVRLHGADAPRLPYQQRYGPRRLTPIAERLCEWHEAGVDIWVYFNNDRHAHAWNDAGWLRDRMSNTRR